MAIFMYTYIYTCLYIYIESPQPVNSMRIEKQRSSTTKYKTFLEYLLHVELIPFLGTALGVRVTCQGYYENPSNIFSFSGVTFHRQPKCGLHCNRRRHQHLNPNWIKFTKNLSHSLTRTHTHKYKLQFIPLKLPSIAVVFLIPYFQIFEWLPP